MELQRFQDLINKYRQKQAYFESISFFNLANDYVDMVKLLEDLRKEYSNDKLGTDNTV